MNLSKMLIKNISKTLIFIMLIFVYGCSNSGLDSTQTSVSSLPITSPPNSNNTFGYTIEIPTGWQIINNNSTNLELSTIKFNNDKDFINPSLNIFIPNTKQTQKELIENILKSTKTNIKLENITKANKFNVVAYEGIQNSANKEYPCYYAFITTNDNFVVMFLSGDMSIKEDLKSVFYNSLKTFKKI